MPRSANAVPAAGSLGGRRAGGARSCARAGRACRRPPLRSRRGSRRRTRYREPRMCARPRARAAPRTRRARRSARRRRRAACPRNRASAIAARACSPPERPAGRLSSVSSTPRLLEDLLRVPGRAELLPHGQVRDQIVGRLLRDVRDLRPPEPSERGRGERRELVAVDAQAAPGRRLEPCEQPQQRRLAAARRTDDRGQSRRVERHVELVQRLDGPRRGAVRARETPADDGAFRRHADSPRHPRASSTAGPCRPTRC